MRAWAQPEGWLEIINLVGIALLTMRILQSPGKCQGVLADADSFWPPTGRLVSFRQVGKGMPLAEAITAVASNVESEFLEFDYFVPGSAVRQSHPRAVVDDDDGEVWQVVIGCVMGGRDQYGRWTSNEQSSTKDSARKRIWVGQHERHFLREANQLM